MSEVGDNSKNQLKSFVERIEKLSEEKDALTEDIKSVFDESKSSGFNNRALRAIIRMRRQDKAEREELEMTVETYKTALGMV